jgi:YVTN family beta-propeller protein
LNVIDTTTMTTVSAITVGDIPQNVVISPDGLQLFVTNQGSNTVSRIDTATNAVIETIPVNPYPYGLAIGPSNCTTSAQQQSAPDPEPTPVAPAPSIWRVTMDPNGGSCTSDEESHTESWTSVVLGYGYVPGVSDCVRAGHEFVGWADAASPNAVVSLPWLVDPSDGMRRGFVAADHSLVAVWREREEDELEDLTGVAPGSWIGGVDRRTAEGGGVVDGCYIPPGTRFGTWMLASR